MRFKLLLFICLFIMNITYAMDTKQSSTPTETEIKDKKTKIVFKKKSRSLYRWIEKENQGFFGSTRIFECFDKNGLKQAGTIQTITESQMSRFDSVACAYIDRLEKIYTSDSKHIWLGAFLFYNFNYLPLNVTKIELLQNYYRSNIPAHERAPKQLLGDSKRKSTPRRSKENISKGSIS